MKSIRIPCLCLLLVAAPLAAEASDFEAALSQETAQFTLRSDSSVIGWGGSDLAVGLFYNEDSDFMLQGSLLQMRQASEQNPLTFGVGVKGYVGMIDRPDEDLLALSVGGQVRYTIAGTMPISIFLEGFYAPAITSFSDAEEIKDYTFGVQIEALPQTIAFVGLRNFKVVLDNGDYELDDDNLHFGVRLTF